MRAAGKWTVIVGAAILVFAAAVLPPPEGWPPAAFRSAGLTLAAITLWATGVVPHGVTAAAYLLGAIGLSLQPSSVVLSGIQSGVFWLVLSGSVIGVAIRHTGLGSRISAISANRIGGSYLAALVGVAAAASVLGFLMPSSMGRVLIVMPIVLALADRYGFSAGRPGRTGMIMVAAAVSFLPAGSILTGLLPSMLLAGAAESVYGIDVTYGRYLLLHYPVMGVLRSAVVVCVAWWLFKDDIAAPVDRQSGEAIQRAEIYLAVILGLALAFWMTDALHGIAPAWIAVSAALILLISGKGLLPRDVIKQSVDLNSLLYVMAVLAIGKVVTSTGLAGIVGTSLTRVLPLAPGADAGNTFWLSLTAAVTGLFVTNPGVPAVLSPLAGELARITSLPIDTVLMTQVAGFSTVLLPYQASPVLVAMAMSGVGFREGTKMLLVVSAVTFIVLLPIEVAWWKLLGGYE